MNMMDWVGQTLGQYRIEAPLDAGGMGQVFRGMHTYLNRPAAIKVMRVKLADDPNFRARFLQEARAAAALRHPNIVEIYDFGDQDGHLYLVMELMTDGSLGTLLHRRAGGQPWPLSLGLDLARQAAEGLAEAHAQGMVHRDIKPDNMLLNRVRHPGQRPEIEQYQLKISDFGLARLAIGSGLTITGAPMGTLAYMSPEQCQGGQLDGRSDLYSLGIVLYQIATGYLPFQISTFEEAQQKHANVAPLPPRQVRSNVPPLLEEIILRCLAKKPEERFATATELSSALQKALSNIDTMISGRSSIVQTRPSPDQFAPTGGTVLQPPGVGDTPPPTVSTLATYTAVPRVRVLDLSGQTLQVVEVKNQGLTIGRQPGNDLVLSDQAISHQHLQVLWDGKHVTVKDLGSRNGTLLEGVRLLPQESQPWMERQMIRIGPYWLRLEGPSPTATQTVQRPLLQIGSMVRSGRIGMSINPQILTITPGQPATTRVTLTNLGSIVDWFTTTVEGVPPQWVQGSGQEVQLNPTMQETVELNVNVARSPDNLAQEYPVTILAHSREQPNESGTVQARWNVLPFTEDTLRLEPRRATGRGSATYAVALQNGGNIPAPTHYELSGEDDEQKMTYQFGANPVDLEHGRKMKVPLTVRTRRHWIGREQRKPFQIHARPAASSIPLTTPGEFVNKALLPTWLLSAVILLSLLLVGGGIIYPVLFDKTTRTVSSTLSQSKVVDATDSRQVAPATFARGVLWFYSYVESAKFYPAGTPFTAHSGVRVVTDADLNVPDSSSGPIKVSVSAHAEVAGSNGNIPAGDIYLSNSNPLISCSSFASAPSDTIVSAITQGIYPSTFLHSKVPFSGGGGFVICNPQAFTGGQDARTDPVIRQSDIDGAADALKLSLTADVQKALQVQIRSDEHLINAPQCTSNVTSDHTAGDIAMQVMVSVTMTCTQEVSN